MPDSNAIQDRLAMLYEQSERETDPAAIERLESEITALAEHFCEMRPKALRRLESALSSRE